MSYTSVLDGDVLQCRASIASEEELDVYIAHLQKQRERLKPPNKEKANDGHVPDFPD
jgi:hypothetical protein